MTKWIERPLGSVATLQRGFDLPHRERRPGSVPIVTSAGLGGFHDRAMVQAPGVVTGRYGTIGKVFLLEDDFWPLNTTLWVSDFHGNDAHFIYYLLQRVDYATHSGKSGVPGVNRNDLHTETVVLPVARAEQQKIASVLSDIGTLVGSLGRLIAKKRDVKQGMMQQLLTGSVRLHGLDSRWADVPISELAKVVGGGTPPTRVSGYWGGEIPWFTPSEIAQEGSGRVSVSNRSITYEGLANSSAHILPSGSVLVTSRASIGHCAVAEVPVSTNQGFASLVPHSLKSTWFLYYLIQQNRRELELKSAGSTFLEISARKVAEIPISAPGLDEQAAIGAALQDVDAEIMAWERRLESVKAIKQGMMQELLTGRTRLTAEAAQ